MHESLLYCPLRWWAVSGKRECTWEPAYTFVPLWTIISPEIFRLRLTTMAETRPEPYLCVKAAIYLLQRVRQLPKLYILSIENQNWNNYIKWTCYMYVCIVKNKTNKTNKVTVPGTNYLTYESTVVAHSKA